MFDLDFNSDLIDRIAKVQSVNFQLNLLNNSYIAISGRDSFVASKLIDISLPNNKIPRVFANTGFRINYHDEFFKYNQGGYNVFHVVEYFLKFVNE